MKRSKGVIRVIDEAGLRAALLEASHATEMEAVRKALARAAAAVVGNAEVSGSGLSSKTLVTPTP